MDRSATARHRREDDHEKQAAPWALCALGPLDPTCGFHPAGAGDLVHTVEISWGELHGCHCVRQRHCVDNAKPATMKPKPTSRLLLPHEPTTGMSTPAR